MQETIYSLSEGPIFLVSSESGKSRAEISDGRIPNGRTDGSGSIQIQFFLPSSGGVMRTVSISETGQVGVIDSGHDSPTDEGIVQPILVESAKHPYCDQAYVTVHARS